MTTPTTQPLAVLLASHPEECAAVVAVLASEGSTEGTAPWSCESLAIEADVPLSTVRGVVVVLIGANVVQGRGDGCTAPVKADRRAIARHGALAWLRERVGPPASTNPLNLGAIRLCALAAEGARIGAIHIASYAVATPFPRNAAEYRTRVVDVSRLSNGLPVAPLDVEAEVAAVWGTPAPSVKGTPT